MTINENWFKTGWRPFLSWAYGCIVVFDFILAPIMMVLYATYTHTPVVPWQSLTLQGGGMLHFSLGAYVTATSFGRTKEKIATFTEIWGKNPVPPTEVKK